MIDSGEYLDRRKRLTEALVEHRVNALLVSALSNIRYLTGFTGSNGLLFISPDAATLLVDPRYTTQAAEETDCRTKTIKGSLYAAAVQFALRKRWRRIGVERLRLGYASWLELEARSDGAITFEPLGPVVDTLRSVKSQQEIDLIRQSVQTNSKAFDRAVVRAKPGAKERELAAEIEYSMRRFGADGAAFESIIAAGPRSALPHARPTDERIASGQLLLMDIGAQQNGYCSDMTRMAHVGPPPVKARKLHRAVLEAQLAAIDSVRAGVKAGAVDRAARSVLKAHGLEQAFVHSTGHGLGLEIHESPRLGRKDETRLEQGMAITIEPGAYLEGFGGVRIEDTVVVTANGCEILTPTSKELMVI